MRLSVLCCWLVLLVLWISCGNPKEKAGQAKEVIMRQKNTTSGQVSRIINKLEQKDTNGISHIMDSLGTGIAAGQDSITQLPSLKGKTDRLKIAATELFRFYQEVHTEILPLHIRIMSKSDEQITAAEEKEIESTFLRVDSLSKVYGDQFRSAVAEFDSLLGSR